MSGLTVTHRVYVSQYHLWAAAHLARLAAEREANPPRQFDIQHRGYVMSSLLESVAFLEALILELLKDAAEDQNLEIIGVIPTIARAKMLIFWKAGERRASTLQKFQSALLCADKAAFDKGAQPYQDAQLVISLRNALVHFRPENTGVADTHDIEAKCRGKFPIHERLAMNPWWPDQCLSAGCADWAVKSVRAFAGDFCTRMGFQPHYQRNEAKGAWPSP